MDVNNLGEFFNDLDYNNMGSWHIAPKSVVGGLVFSVVLGLFVYLVANGQYEELETIARKEVDLKSEFEKKQKKAANLEDYKQQMKTIEENFKILLQQLPKSTEMAGLLDELSYAATGAGCEMVGAEFQDEKDSEFYAEKPISLTVSGGYHQLADFVSRISRLSRIVTLHDFNIAIAGGSVASNPEEKLLVMSVTAKTYRSDSEEK